MKPITISIKEPCNEDWQKMTPKEQGRHCASCNKCVVDFTNFTDKEIINYLAENRSQQTCGRFTTSQLGRNINPAPKEKGLFPVYRLAASFFIGGLSLISTKLMAQFPQVQEEVSQKEEQSNRARQIVISGSVRDIGTGDALENASLRIGKDSVYSDSLGNYSFEYNGLDSILTFLIEADGYVKKEAVISLSHLLQGHSSILTSDFELEKTSNEHLLTINVKLGEVCVPEFADIQSIQTFVLGGFITGNVYNPPAARDSVLVKGRKFPLVFLKEKTKDSVDEIRQRFSTKFLGKFKRFPFSVKNDSLGISSIKRNKKESNHSNKEELPLKPRMEAVIVEDKLKRKS